MITVNHLQKAFGQNVNLLKKFAADKIAEQVEIIKKAEEEIN